MIPGDFRPTRPSAKQLVKYGVLTLLGLFSVAVVVGVLMFVISAWLGRPLSVFGFDEGPAQPIAFPHITHVQVLGLDCTFCHRNVTKGAAATVPPVGLCMTCHKVAGDGLPEVEKLRTLYAEGKPIDWVRVHRVPDFVRFNHQAHIGFFSGAKTVVDVVREPGAQLALAEARNIKPGAVVGDVVEVLPSQVCSTCHGQVDEMIKVRQVRVLKMGDCVDCHRENDAPTDCVACHY